MPSSCPPTMPKKIGRARHKWWSVIDCFFTFRFSLFTFQLRSNTALTPTVVPLLSYYCPLVVHFIIEQQTDNKRTTNGQQSESYRSHPGLIRYL